MNEYCLNCYHWESNEAYCRLHKETHNGYHNCKDWKKDKFK